MTREEIFAENFNVEAYRKVELEILRAIQNVSKLSDFTLAYKELRGYDIDNNNDEDPEYWWFDVERELDRSAMETDADFVSVAFEIVYCESSHEVFINEVCLYVAFEVGGNGPMCIFDRDTYKIKEWLWDGDYYNY